ncbi:LysM peptidoglycan-binding domain-containing protein [Melghirimyces algeriensis]|uniref:LysM domain-containing protein n=1 Tax=Melghirimyces algeriensis TaxID=910412 RepID=A0A521ATV3_9BACL|nr:LysM peptidoglycan-binding domain-containing protein [Melghirimyces algeriensis]SMO38288.1 LysM domain-containing protein [Melghirimyces algeriensis]
MKLHIVQPGDSLEKIARRFDIPLKRLVEVNPNLDVAELKVGSKVRIPGKKVPLNRRMGQNASISVEKPRSAFESPESPESSMEKPLPERRPKEPMNIPPMPKAPEYGGVMSPYPMPGYPGGDGSYGYPMPYPPPSRHFEPFHSPVQMPYPPMSVPPPWFTQQPWQGEPGQSMPFEMVPGYGQPPQQPFTGYGAPPMNPFFELSQIPYPESATKQQPEKQSFEEQTFQTEEEEGKEEDTLDFSSLLYEEADDWKESSSEK